VSDRHGLGKLFDDPNWERLFAPVVPPARVVAELKLTRRHVFWENGKNREDDKTLAGNERNWLMLYRTEYDGDKIVTRLLPGSAQPVKGWLRTR